MKFQTLLAITLVIFSLSSFTIRGLNKIRQINALTESPQVISAKVENFTVKPFYVGIDSPPTFSAESVLAVDMDSNTILFEKDPDAPHSPASTTKIITALVAMDYYPLNKVLTVGKVQVEGQKMKLVNGEEILVRDLLYGLLVYSANDAAEVLAQNYEGGREAFIEAMNVKAVRLGLDRTFFTNPSGLDGNIHISSSRDLVKAASIAIKNPFFKQVVSTKDKLVTSVDGKIQHKLVNLNELVGKVEGVLGVKTGWTEGAQENLVTYVERDQKRIMIALLGSKNRFADTEKLINWIFTDYEWRIVSTSDTP